ncbi:hypothetical protein CDCA_CDCA04G1175 [Cyanidium caldarium]|uniref:Uncharacterized protein n=1 Tax=Cyanidium caldarium TaxID=2771 RepID=A0AAV9IST4_CYACA|nr:hypothetical protein CDCA_CDCA04G1175 [Cyanidium caldarium]
MTASPSTSDTNPSTYADEVRAAARAWLLESGAWWVLQRHFRETLDRCGWRARIKQRCRECLRAPVTASEVRTGAADLRWREDDVWEGAPGLYEWDIDALIARVGDETRSTVPAGVQRALLQEVDAHVLEAYYRAVAQRSGEGTSGAQDDSSHVAE